MSALALKILALQGRFIFLFILLDLKLVLLQIPYLYEFEQDASRDLMQGL